MCLIKHHWRKTNVYLLLSPQGSEPSCPSLWLLTCSMWEEQRPSSAWLPWRQMWRGCTQLSKLWCASWRATRWPVRRWSASKATRWDAAPQSNKIITACVPSVAENSSQLKTPNLVIIVWAGGYLNCDYCISVSRFVNLSNLTPLSYWLCCWRRSARCSTATSSTSHSLLWERSTAVTRPPSYPTPLPSRTCSVILRWGCGSRWNNFNLTYFLNLQLCC